MEGKHTSSSRYLLGGVLLLALGAPLVASRALCPRAAPLQRVPSHGYMVADIAFGTGSDTVVAFGAACDPSADPQCAVLVANPRLRTTAGRPVEARGATPASISCCAVSPAGGLIAFADPGGAAIGDASSGRRLWPLLEANTTTLNAMAFSQNGRLFAAAGGRPGTLWLRDTLTGNLKRKIQLTQKVISAVALSHDGSLVAVSSADGRITLWNTATGALAQQLAGHRLPWRLAFGRNCLAVAGHFPTVDVWDLRSGKLLRQFSGAETYFAALACSRDGSLLAGATDDGVVRVWSLASGKQVHMMRGAACEMNALAFSDDGALLAAGDDQGISVWRMD